QTSFANGRTTPGPGLPRVAQTAWWLWNSPHVLEACHRRHGDVFALKLAPRLVSGPGAGPADGRWIFLADPDDVRQVHTADPAVVRTGETNEFLKGLVGPASILLLDEPEHMTQRRLLLPPLHGERVQRYAALMAEI